MSNVDTEHPATQRRPDTATTLAVTDPSKDEEDVEVSSSLSVTLLCTSGSRVVIELTPKLLKSCDITVNDLSESTVLSLKKVIYSAFESPADKPSKSWTTQLVDAVSPPPASPTHIRLIHLGKVLVDDYPLSEYKITTDSPVNVVHFSVKPEELGNVEQEPAKIKPSRNRSASNLREPEIRTGCCVIC